MRFLHLCLHILLTIVFLAAMLSGLVIGVLAEEEMLKAIEEQLQENDVTTSDDSSNGNNSKVDKRSQEEIMFGNQQNKPSGLVDDLMSMSDSSDDNSNGSQAQDSKSDVSSIEENKPSTGDDLMMHSGYSDWDKMAYQDSLPMVDLVNSLYDQKEMYQPVRQRQIPLRKRSLRSSLGQMIQKRGIRMPRRSMRLKRQVDVEDLLNLFENDRFYNEDAAQVTPHSFSGRARTVAKRHVPGRYGGYSEQPEYRYPYVFQHRDNGILAPQDLEEDTEMDDLMLLPPNARYIDEPQQDTDMSWAPNVGPLGLGGPKPNYGMREDAKKESAQRWLLSHTIPSVFRMSKRASPFFYPVDYRYVPASGFKKRSNGNGHAGRYLDDETEGDFGKWGHVVQVPEAYASPEDIARLYGLANLLSEGDEVRKRRSA